MDTIRKEINQITDVLAETGVTSTTLDEEAKKSLDQRGFAVLNQFMEADLLDSLRTEFEKVMQREGYEDGRVLDKNEEESMGDKIARQFNKDEELHYDITGERKVDNLVNKGKEFEQIYIKPALLGAVYHIYQEDFKLSGLFAEEAVSGEGETDLISDEEITCLLLLDDFNIENGGIIVESNNLDKKDVFVEAPAGSAFIIKGNIPFKLTKNQSNSNRRMLTVNYTKRDKEPKLNQLEYIRRNTYVRLSQSAKYVLNIEM